MTRIWFVNWHFQSRIILWYRHKSTNVSIIIMLTDAQVYCMIYLFRPPLIVKATCRKTAEAKLYIYFKEFKTNIMKSDILAQFEPSFRDYRWIAGFLIYIITVISNPSFEFSSNLSYEAIQVPTANLIYYILITIMWKYILLRFNDSIKFIHIKPCQH